MSAKFKRVCIATDFSEPAARAFAHAVALANLNGAELHALHVLSDLGPVPGTDHRLGLEIAREYFNRLRERGAAPVEEATPVTAGQPPGAHVLEDLERGVQEQFAALPAAQEAVPAFKQAIRFGNPVDEICNYVREQGVDLLVVGTHGRTAVGRLLTGSVAERLVRASPCAVLTVGDRRESPPRHT